jgi:multidrug resistance efflux pump
LVWLSVYAGWLAVIEQAAGEAPVVATIDKATVIPLRDIEMHAKQIGVLEALFVKEGASVKAFDTLAVVAGGARRVEIVAPFAGVVTKTPYLPGEAVKADQSVVRLVQLHRMVIQGGVKLDRETIAGLRDKKARVSCRLDGGCEEFVVEGRVISVSPTTDKHGNQQVRVEVANAEKAGKWLLQPGQVATVKILGDEK